LNIEAGGILDFNRFNFVNHPEHGECLPGPQAVVYCRWMAGANYVGLRAGVLTYQVDGLPERQVQPVRCDGVDVYPISALSGIE
jgi:hypothetical protein